MTSDEGAFNLLDSPWVRARTLTGDVCEFSTREVLTRAHELRGLAGEVATQDVAVFRILMAILYGATRPSGHRSVEEALDLWAAWWRLGQLPMTEIGSYLERWRGRFFLFHDQLPFLQVADLHTTSGNRSGLVKLIADIPDGYQYFTTRAGRQVQSLSFAEATRWLVNCHAFDPAGIKTGAVGDRRTAGGRVMNQGYPAWAGTLGIVMVEGTNLFESLMLNWQLTKAKQDDVPVWERAPLSPSAAANHPSPSGPADLLTWPSRRVLLVPREDRVVDVQISYGDVLGPQNQVRNEPMSAWRKSTAQSRASNDVYMPVTHAPERRIWQGLEPLLVTVEGVSSRASVLDWLALLRWEGLLTDRRTLQVRTIGLEYRQASSIIASVDDGLSSQIIALVDPVLTRTAADAAARASQGVTALVNLSSNLAMATGYDPTSSPKDNERRRASVYECGYSLLDGPFREWVGALDDPATAPDRLESWGKQAQDTLLEAGARLIIEAGPAATVGRRVPDRLKRSLRDVNSKDKPPRIDAGLAEIWFRAALKKALVSQPVSAQPQEAAS
jgi:CRISPR system Cascade subunit CasA